MEVRDREIARVAAQGGDLGTGAATGLDARQRVLDDQTPPRRHAKVSGGEQVALRIGLSDTYVVGRHQDLWGDASRL